MSDRDERLTPLGMTHKTSPSRPMALPGAPPPDKPDDPVQLPVEPDDAGLPNPTSSEDDEGGPWTPPA